MDDKDLERLAEIIAEKLNNSKPVCALGIDKKEFEVERAFVHSLMRIADRLDGIKWGFLGSLIKSTGYVLLGLTVAGALMWAKNKLGLSTK